MTMPLAHDDWPTHDWITADAAAVGIDPAALDRAGDVLNTRYPNLDTLLVARHGRLVYERYAGTQAGRDRVRGVKSVTKSITGLLAGIALDKGDLSGLDQMIGALLPESFTSTSDERTRSIRIRDLLTMRSGLDWREWEGSTLEMFASADWVRFVLARPQAHDPGQVFKYSTGDTHLLAAAIQRQSGLTLLDYADAYLFGPLGITQRRWLTDPQGICIGGSELKLRARDMAKIGLLMLHDGVWDDQRILPPGWAAESVTPHADAGPGGRDCVPLHYGYLWWLRSQGPHPSALAVGYGGQYIITVPALDLVVVIMGDLRKVPKDFSDNRMLCQFNLVQDVILPGVE